MTANTMIVDGNAIGYANNSAVRLTVGDMQTQAIFGFAKQMHVLMRAYYDYSPLVLWDGRAQWRFDMLPPTDDHPGYKGDRDKDPKQAAMRDEYKKQRPYIEEMLKHLGVRQMLVTTHEADDMAGYLISTIKGGKILTVTGDMDWAQLVGENVEFLDPIHEKRINLRNFLEMTGYFSPEAFLQGKALMGDTSDKIPPVGGIGEKGAPLFLAEHGSVKAWFDSMPRIDGYTDQKALIKQLKAMPKAWINIAYGGGIYRFAANLKLMNLRAVPKPEKQNVIVTHEPFNEAGFRDFCERFAFHSILRDFNTFVAPFRR
jgi:DNA polymerase-1